MSKSNYIGVNRKRAWKRAKRSFRYNVKSLIKKCLYENLPNKIWVDLSTWNDNGY